MLTVPETRPAKVWIDSSRLPLRYPRHTPFHGEGVQVRRVQVDAGSERHGLSYSCACRELTGVCVKAPCFKFVYWYEQTASERTYRAISYPSRKIGRLIAAEMAPSCVISRLVVIVP